MLCSLLRGFQPFQMRRKPAIRFRDELFIESLLACAGLVAGYKQDRSSIRVEGIGGRAIRHPRPSRAKPIFTLPARAETSQSAGRVAGTGQSTGPVAGQASIRYLLPMAAPSHDK